MQIQVLALDNDQSRENQARDIIPAHCRTKFVKNLNKKDICWKIFMIDSNMEKRIELEKRGRKADEVYFSFRCLL